MLVGVVVASTFGFGALSAWSATRQVFAAPYDAGRGSTADREQARLRGGLAVFEVSAAVLVLVSTGLMLKGAMRVAAQAPGFDPGNVLTMEINLPGSGRYADPAQTTRFFQDLVKRVGTLPQVQDVSAGNPPPFVGWAVAYEAEGNSPVSADQRPRTIDAVVMPGYFRTLRIPVLDGRDFTDRDAGPASTPVVVVSQAFARATWPDANPLGKRFRLTGGEERPWMEVVGLVGDTRTSTFSPPRGWVYLPHGQRRNAELVLVIRFQGDAAAVIRDVKRLVWEVEPALPVHWNDLLDDVIARRYWQPRLYPRLFALFATLALAVALVGVYAVVAWRARRAREFGIRIAIGSPSSHVWRLVFQHGLRLAVVGTSLGMIAALGLMRFASAVFFGVSPTDPAVYAACGALVVTVVLLTSAAPAFRAAGTDPVAALRCE